MKIKRIPEKPEPVESQRSSDAAVSETSKQGHGKRPTIPQNPLVQQLFRLGKRREDAEAKLEKRFTKKKKA